MLREMLLCEESDNAELYSEEERSELLFRIFEHLVLGGACCQFEVWCDSDALTGCQAKAPVQSVQSVRLCDATAGCLMHCILMVCSRVQQYGLKVAHCMIPSQHEFIKILLACLWAGLCGTILGGHQTIIQAAGQASYRSRVLHVVKGGDMAACCFM